MMKSLLGALGASFILVAGPLGPLFCRTLSNHVTGAPTVMTASAQPDGTFMDSKALGDMSSNPSLSVSIT